MRVLMISRCPVDDRLGAAQVLLRLAEGVRRRGHAVDLVGPDRLGWAPADGIRARAHKTRAYVRAHAEAYDVADVDHVYLPFPRDAATSRLGVVARSQLLVHHLAATRFPSRARGARAVREEARDLWRRARLWPRARMATATARAADGVVVLNAHERDTLVRHGVEAGKVHVIRNGLDPSLGAPPRRGEPGGAPRIAFVGSFTARKGAADLPLLLDRVTRAVPGAGLLLLGTGGTVPGVRAAFPERLRAHVEVVPRFERSALLALLGPCRVGVVPSYMEGFGLGVIEMLAARLPVLAYDCPGPSDILGPEGLVPRGDVEAMARRVVRALEGPRVGGPGLRERYDWAAPADALVDVYQAVARA